jgi:hypothetical protein
MQRSRFLIRRRLLAILPAIAGTPVLLSLPSRPAQAAQAAQATQIRWVFDRLDQVGGLRPRVEGNPRVVDAPGGKAVQFDGVDDALFIDQHPLAGAATFTFEAVFRPDGGAFEQRWFHLASDEPAAEGTRFLFEIRVVGNEWYLDTYTHGAGYAQTLIFPEQRHPVGAWHHVAQTFDGRFYRAWVNGQLQGEAEIAFKPQGPGKASVGVRMNRVNYFKGAVREARFTHAALEPAQFIRI